MARLHPYRLDDNTSTAIVRVNFVDPDVIRSAESTVRHVLEVGGPERHAPLLNMPALSEKESA